ncbi:MAG: polyphenol oxidase family protein [Candidatus Moraniibacteriota bacterium]
MKKVLKGFSERIDGSMYLPTENPLPENVANRKRFFEMNKLGGRKIVVARLTHSSNVTTVDARSEYFIPDTDALVTRTPEILLTLTGADCFPVYFEEKTAGIIGLAHCGWRGIVDGIVEKTIAAIIEMGGKAENIVLTIGPGICEKHFEIKEDILSFFSAYPEFIFRDKNVTVDLKGIIKKQASVAGIVSTNILDTNECTYCLDEKYFSYRRDKSDPIEAQIAYIIQFPHRKF